MSVEVLKQMTHRAGWTPTNSNTLSAMRLWRFQCSTATATISPPTNSMFVSFRYCIHTWKPQKDTYDVNMTYAANMAEKFPLLLQ